MTVNSIENLKSCVIRIGRQKFRPLLDTGAAVSIVNSNVYWSLPYPSKLSKPKVNLKSVSGTELKIQGCASIQFKIALLAKNPV